jgi:hypothetical protein
VLVLPFLQAILISAFIVGWIISLAHLISGSVLPPEEGGWKKIFSFDQLQIWSIVLYVLALFWIILIISALIQYILIVATCNWYFSHCSCGKSYFSLSKGFWWALRYNLGSIALGSLVVAVFWLARTVFEYVNSKMQNLNAQNAAFKCLSCVLRCCLDCCHRFIKFLNKNAYI